MSYITQAELARTDAARRAITALLLEQGRSDGGHRLVWTLFAGADAPEGPAPEDAKRDFLYRETEPGRYLIVSRRPPTDPQGLWQLESKAYRPAPPVGGRFAFVLRANPTVAVPAPGARRGHRADVIVHARHKAGAALDREEREAAALEWLEARAPRLGFRLERVLCSAGGYRQVEVARAGARAMRFSVIDYEGVLEVTDPAALTPALTGGIGRARAFGCGLLLLRPLGRAPGE